MRLVRCASSCASQIHYVLFMCASSCAPRQVRPAMCAPPCAPSHVRLVMCASSCAPRQVRLVRCASSWAPRQATGNLPMMKASAKSLSWRGICQATGNPLVMKASVESLGHDEALMTRCTWRGAPDEAHITWRIWRAHITWRTWRGAPNVALMNEAPIGTNRSGLSD